MWLIFRRIKILEITYTNKNNAEAISDWDLEKRLNETIADAENSLGTTIWYVSTSNIINYARLRIEQYAKSIDNMSDIPYISNNVEVRFMYYDKNDYLCEVFCDNCGNLDNSPQTTNDAITSQLIDWMI